MTDEELTVGDLAGSAHPDSPVTQELPAFAGARLYSPLIIALYSFFANLPLALVLLGLNLRARGRQLLGGLLLAVAALGALYLAFAENPRDSSKYGERISFLVDLVVAYGLYVIEKAAYLDALAHGAVTARWWVPAIWLLVFLLVGLVFLHS